MSVEHFLFMADIAGHLAGALPLAYLLYALGCLAAWRPRPPGTDRPRPPVTVLKPVCGHEPALYDNLATFCRQDYPRHQVVFGVGRADDAALPTLRRLIADHPGLDAALAVGDGGPGLNPKVGNLINMDRHARHGLLVIADSDVTVGPDFLDRVAAALADERVGVVSFPYVGRPGGGLVSRLGALSINAWFIPSVLVSRSLRPLGFCLGAAIAIRRPVLERIGGFAALRPYLADDYMLGKLVRDAGYRVELGGATVGTAVPECRLRDLWRQEVRWARTIGSMEPWGHVFSVVTLFVPMALLAGALAADAGLALAVLAAGTALRALVGVVAGARLGVRDRGGLWLAPVRDLMNFLVWAASFAGRTVAWRGARFVIRRDGRMEPAGEPAEPARDVS